MTILRRKIALIISVVLISANFNVAQAAGASLFLNPASGEFTVNKTFTVKIMVNSGGGVGINASEAVVKYDTEMLSVSKVEKNGSVFSLWTQEPSFSNTEGTVSFGGGSPAGYKGSAGAICSVTFLAKKVGEAKVSISSGSVLAADGKGTNVYTGGQGGVFTIIEEPKKEEKAPVKKEEPEKKETATGILPPTPEVGSDTHPDENTWYSNNEPNFTWRLLSDIETVSLLLDKESTSDPGANVDGIIESKIIEAVPDGIHYFHLKLKNKFGWGKVSHRKVQIDVTPPRDFRLSIDDRGDATNPTPILIFDTVDETSGMDKYVVTLDGNKIELTPRDFKAEPYRFDVLAPGNHDVFVNAFDKAGNMASSSMSFIVEPLKAPIIREIPREINQGDQLIIRGNSFYSNVTIRVFFRLGKEEYSWETKTDENGNWNYFHSEDLEKGVYEVWARVVDGRGAQSLDTARFYVSVISPGIIAEYGLYIILFLILVIIGLIAYIMYERKKRQDIKQRAVNETIEARKRVNEVFLALHEELDELIEYADKRAGVSESERRVRDKLSEALNISEEFISKEIEDIDKEVLNIAEDKQTKEKKKKLQKLQQKKKLKKKE